MVPLVFPLFSLFPLFPPFFLFVSLFLFPTVFHLFLFYVVLRFFFFSLIRFPVQKNRFVLRFCAYFAFSFFVVLPPVRRSVQTSDQIEFVVLVLSSARTIHDVRFGSQLHFIHLRNCQEKIIASFFCFSLFFPFLFFLFFLFSPFSLFSHFFLFFSPFSRFFSHFFPFFIFFLFFYRFHLFFSFFLSFFHVFFTFFLLPFFPFLLSANASETLNRDFGVEPRFDVQRRQPASSDVEWKNAGNPKAATKFGSSVQKKKKTEKQLNEKSVVKLIFLPGRFRSKSCQNPRLCFSKQPRAGHTWKPASRLGRHPGIRLRECNPKSLCRQSGLTTLVEAHVAQGADQKSAQCTSQWGIMPGLPIHPCSKERPGRRRTSSRARSRQTGRQGGSRQLGRDPFPPRRRPMGTTAFCTPLRCQVKTENPAQRTMCRQSSQMPHTLTQLARTTEECWQQRQWTSSWTRTRALRNTSRPRRCRQRWRTTNKALHHSYVLTRPPTKNRVLQQG